MNAIVEAAAAADETTIDHTQEWTYRFRINQWARPVCHGALVLSGNLGTPAYRRAVLNAVLRDESMKQWLWFIAECERITRWEWRQYHKMHAWMEETNAPELLAEEAIQALIAKIERVEEKTVPNAKKQLKESMRADPTVSIDVQNPTDAYRRKAALHHTFNLFDLKTQIRSAVWNLELARERLEEAKKYMTEEKEGTMKTLLRHEAFRRDMKMKRGRALAYPLSRTELERQIDRTFPNTLKEIGVDDKSTAGEETKEVVDGK